jgi:hypothetical protein
MSFFYNLNKTLDAIREKPELTHGQLNERDMSRAAKGYEKYGKEGMEALAKAGREGKDLDKVRAKYDKYDESVDEGFGDAVKKVGSMAKKLGQKAITTLGHGDDAEMIRDLQRKMGVPQTGMKPGSEPNPKQVKEKMNPAKAKSFAALAEPKDKITFADKIAGAKKEVDEMLGDVAAEAMKSALSGGQKKLDKNNNGKLDANDFAMLRKGGKKQVADEGFPTVASARAEMNKRKVGDVTHGAKHDTEETPTGRRVTRRLDPNTGYSVGSDTDDEGNTKSNEKRGRGRPKKADKQPERVTANATKHKGGRKVKEEDMGEGADEGNDLVKLSKVIASCTTPEQLKAAQKMAQHFLAKHDSGANIGTFGGNLRRDLGRSRDVNATIKAKSRELGGEKELEEKAVSKKQQKFMGMVHATQKGEKAPSKEVAKVAKTMKKGDAEDFAATKHKGLPEKKKPEAKSDAPKKKKEKTEEAGGSGTPTASSGFSFGQGIYDSMNHELENMISESMSINVSSSTEGGKNITVTASEDDADKLAAILKSAGLGGDSGYGGSGYKSACGCGTPDCSCGDEEMDEAAPAVTDNAPDYPTDEVSAQDNFEYSGGLNKPKSTGQTTTPIIHTSDEERQYTYAEAEQDDIKRMMEMAGIKEGKKPDFLDVDKDGDKKEPFKKAVDDKKEKKVDEGILASTANLWSEYKGKYGV